MVFAVKKPRFRMATCVLICTVVAMLQTGVFAQPLSDFVPISELQVPPSDSETSHLFSLHGYHTMMALDEEDDLYIIDYQSSTILKYHPDGQRAAVIGGEGEDPGHFEKPSVFTYDQEKIYVVDQGNHRIQILDREGHPLGSFKTLLSPAAIAAHEGKMYQVLITPQVNQVYDQPRLISVFDENGRLLHGFGEYLTLVPDLSTFASKSILEVYNDHLYVLSKYYPLLRVYTLEGELVRTLHFEGQGYEARVPGNYEWEVLKEKGGGLYPFTFLFRALEVNDKGIFIGLHTTDIIIDHYDLEGTFLQQFMRNDPDDAVLVDFAVRQQDKETLKFYVLSRRPDYISKMTVLMGSF